MDMMGMNRGLNYNAVPFTGQDMMNKLFLAMQPPIGMHMQPGLMAPLAPAEAPTEALEAAAPADRPKRTGCKRKGKRERARARQLRERQEAEAAAAALDEQLQEAAAAQDSMATVAESASTTTLQTTASQDDLQESRMKLYQALMFGEEDEGAASPQRAVARPMLETVQVTTPVQDLDDDSDDEFPPLLGTPLMSPYAEPADVGMGLREAALREAAMRMQSDGRQSHDQLTSEGESRHEAADSDSESDDDELLLLPGGLL